jgi:hypothetical protein
MKRTMRGAAVTAFSIAMSACQGQHTVVTGIDVKCEPANIVSTMASTVTATVTEDAHPIMGRTVKFDRSSCGAAMNPETASTASGNSTTTTLNEGEAQSTFTGNTNTKCVATITATAVNANVSKTCTVTVMPLPITQEATFTGVPPAPGVTNGGPMVTVTPDVSQNNPFTATYTITTSPTSSQIIGLTADVAQKANFSTGHVSTSVPDPPNGVTHATFTPHDKTFDTDSVKVVTDSGVPGGTATIDVALKDGSGHALHATFTTLPGPKP